MDEVPKRGLYIFLAAQANSSEALIFFAFLIFFLILLNGFFSASEMAVITMNHNRVRQAAEKGDPTAKLLAHLIDHQGNFLATIQIGVTLAGFLSAAFGAERISPVLLHLLDPDGKARWLTSIATIAITFIISFLSLVLGELVPKRIALGNPEGFARRFATVLHFTSTIFTPFSVVLNGSSDLVARLLHLRNPEEGSEATEEEIRLMTEVGRVKGTIQSEEANMISNVFELDDKDVSEIMTPRTAVQALEVSSPWPEVAALLADGTFSRIPVYQDHVDQIVGVLHIKDLLARLPIEEKSFQLRDFLRPALFVPASKKVDELFRELRQVHTTMAIVVDEYGGVDGIVTMEDILEEVVGAIEDEYDDAVEPCIERPDGSYVLDASLTPEEAGHYIPEIAEMKEDDDYETMAGFVLSLLQRIPGEKERATVRFRNLRFTVLKMDEKRIASLLVEKMPEEATAEAAKTAE